MRNSLETMSEEKQLYTLSSQNFLYTWFFPIFFFDCIFFSFVTHRLDVQYHFVDYLYTPTYTRIGAYFIGVYAGWFLSAKDRKLNIKKVNYVRCTFDFSQFSRCVEWKNVGTVQVTQYRLLWYNRSTHCKCAFSKTRRMRGENIRQFPLDCTKLFCRFVIFFFSRGWTHCTGQ